MSELAGRTGLIVGVANKRSLAWSIAQQADAAGARLVLTYQNERLKENVEELAAVLTNAPLLVPCDVSRDEDITRLFDALGEQIDGLDLLSVYQTCRSPLLVVNAISPAADAAAAPDLPWLPEFHAAFRRGLAKDLQELAARRLTVHYQELDVDHGLVLNATEVTAELVCSFLAEHARW